MQLINKQASVRLALAAASSTLLAGAAKAEENTPWLVDSALAVYSESDSRVTAVEPIVSLKKDMGGERTLGLKLTLDSLTGASPNGAIAANEAQTFTGPSGNGSYTSAKGETPLDTEFKDSRAAVAISWEQPWGERNRVSLGGNVSKEYDFTSASINAAIARDFNEKNTTLSLGVNFETDSINAVGGTPDPLSSLKVGKNTDGKTSGSESKKVTDLLLGVTQVMNRHWLTQINFSLGETNGYNSDPYKILSVVNADGSLATSPDATSKWYLYDSRPDKRSRKSIYWGNKIHLTEDVIDLSYRYYTDDWGIKSSTLDLRYRYEFAGNMYLEPHVRWYTQTSADFYHLYLTQGVDTTGTAAALDYASADSRLGEFTGTTFGLKYGIELGRNREFNIRVEQYKQTSDASAPASMTALKGLDLSPDLKAMTVLVGYSFEF
jgi:hypothetical protein